MAASQLVVVVLVVLALVSGREAVLDDNSVQIAQFNSPVIFNFCNQTNNRFVPGATLCRYDRNCFLSLANTTGAAYGPYLTLAQLNATIYSTFTVSRTSGNIIPYFAAEVTDECCDNNCNCTPLLLSNFPTCVCPPNLTPIGVFDDVGCIPGTVGKAPASAPVGATVRVPAQAPSTLTTPVTAGGGAATPAVPGATPARAPTAPGSTGDTPCISPELTAAASNLPYTCSATCKAFLAAQGAGVYTILTQNLPVSVVNGLYTNCAVPVPSG